MHLMQEYKFVKRAIRNEEERDSMTRELTRELTLNNEQITHFRHLSKLRI